MLVKPYKYKEFKKLLNNNGYFEIRQCGSHKIFSNGQYQLSLPVTGNELNKYLTNDLIKHFNLNRNLL